MSQVMANVPAAAEKRLPGYGPDKMPHSMPWTFSHPQNQHGNPNKGRTCGSARYSFQGL